MDLDQIRRQIIAAISSDDYLFETLVLKGGNALSLVYEIGNRASLDLDYSMEGDFEDLQEVEARLFQALRDRLDSHNLLVFDTSLTPKPLDPIDPIWGGYKAEFKLIEKSRASEFNGMLEPMRRQALTVNGHGQGQRIFRIEISRREYCEDKIEKEVADFPVYVYTLPLIVAEKLRAICQQMDGYDLQKSPTPRPRDFYDIHAIVTQEELDLSDQGFLEQVNFVFQAKRVPLQFLSRIPETFGFHEPAWPSVSMTVQEEDRGFEFYFRFVVDEIEKLESLWKV